MLNINMYMCEFYVYVWKDPGTNSVFYVGKGKKNRAWSPHSTQRCGNKLRNLLKRGVELSSIVQIVESNLTEQQALTKETELISFYKRIEDGGTLFNYVMDTKAVTKHHKKKEINPVLLKQINKMYNQGHSAQTIAKLYNVNSGTILRWLRLNGAIIRPNNFPRKTNKLNHGEIINKYKSGLSVSKLAKYYNVSVGIILPILKNNEVVIRGRRVNYPQEIIDDVVNSYCHGISSIQIAKKYNTALCNILRILAENKIPMRTKAPMGIKS